MEAGAQAKARPSPGRPARLPQQPRKREEFAASSKLAGAGAKIAASAPTPRDESPERPQEGRSPPRRGNPAARGNTSARGDSSARGSTSARGDSSARGKTTRRDGSPPKSGAQPEQVEAAEDLTARRPPSDEAKTGGNASDKVAGEDRYVDALELARGGEALLRALGDLHSANTDLKRQLEHQVDEVVTLQEAGRGQQQLLRDFERQAEAAKHAETAKIEDRVREEIGQREAQLQKELDAANEQAEVDREEFKARLQEMDGDFKKIEGQRDEARGRIRELEERLGIAASAPEEQVERRQGLEMELSLVRARFARETDAKKAAERVSADSQARQQELKMHFDKAVAQVKQLQKALAEQTELANFRQEICNDLQLRLKDQVSEAETKLRREKGKFEAVSRLEGILPRHFLMQALS